MKNTREKSEKIYDVIIIGGGASGLMAAGVAAADGRSVLLLEKNPILGKKLSITGGSRCNITNDTRDVNTFLEKFPETKKFLYSPFAQFAVEGTFDFFEKELNLPLTTKARMRTFPTSEKAIDVCKALVAYAKKNNVEILVDSPVTSITKNDDEITSVTCGKMTYHGKRFILAAGGVAAPETGSTGDGFRFLKDIGHTIDEPNPNIVPLTTDTKWVHRLTGTTLDDIRITFSNSIGEKIKKNGKILFTHFGISGPLILNSAYEVKELLSAGPVEASIDLFPMRNEGELDKDFLALFEKNKNKDVKNTLTEILPRSVVNELLGKDILTLSDKKINEISKSERAKLVKKCKNLNFPITGTLGFEKAVIADGGVIPQEVNFKTMQSKLYPNLYLIGDTLSINRPSGGYSLQLCWTTAWVAATHT